MSRKPARGGFAAIVTKSTPAAIRTTGPGPRDPKLEEARRLALKNLADMTDEEDAAITADALADPDNPPADDLIRRRGRPPLARTKEAVKLRLDPDVLDHFRATGDGWQTRMNDALRKAAGLK